MRHIAIVKHLPPPLFYEQTLSNIQLYKGYLFLNLIQSWFHLDLNLSHKYVVQSYKNIPNFYNEIFDSIYNVMLFYKQFNIVFSFDILTFFNLIVYKTVKIYFILLHGRILFLNKGSMVRYNTTACNINIFCENFYSRFLQMSVQI